jgi:hypothetical protein
MTALLAQFPPPPTDAQTTTPAEPEVPEGWCRRHDVQMKQ